YKSSQAQDEMASHQGTRHTGGFRLQPFREVAVVRTDDVDLRLGQAGLPPYLVRNGAGFAKRIENRCNLGRGALAKQFLPCHIDSPCFYLRNACLGHANDVPVRRKRVMAHWDGSFWHAEFKDAPGPTVLQPSGTRFAE